jgi:hypothetical protein
MFDAAASTVAHGAGARSLLVDTALSFSMTAAFPGCKTDGAASLRETS